MFRVDELRVVGAVALAMPDPLCGDGRTMTSPDLFPKRSPDIFEYGGQEVQALCQRWAYTSVAGQWTMGATDA